MKTRLNKKLMLIPLAMLIAGGVSACSTNNGGNLIWSTSSAEKVYLDKDISLYEGIKGEKKVDITAFRGEHEGKQLVITPENDVTWFDANVGDLTSSNGSTIPSSKITIYVEKYLRMTSIYDVVSTAPTGRVPDGLVPVKNSLAYGDNTIKAHENQALYIDVDVPADQLPGTYNGTIEVTIDGLVYKVPMIVNVLDVTVNQETHSRSVFLDHWQFWNGELDMSQEMLEKYHRELGEYRLSPYFSVLENEVSFTDEGISYYVDKTYEQLQNPKITTICIPYQTAAKDGQQSFSEPMMKTMIKAFWKKSVETNYNMIEKLAVYFGGLIDEPDDFGILDRANYVCDRYKICISECATECDALDASSPIHDELVDAIRKIPNIVTSPWLSTTDGHIETYCPKANFYDEPEERAHYDSQREKWWYTCCVPRMPYPTYHLEDSLSSARMLSWMASNYDVVGNLFWAVNVYAQITDDGYVPISNYYTGKADRYWNCNGDGYLMYPGKQYGYDGPLPSLRLQAIRDGNEEYEVLYNLKEKAKSLGLDDKGVFSYLTNSIYEGTKVLGGATYMEQSRAALANLTIAQNNGSDFTISKSELGEKTLSMEFYAKNGTTIKVNGESLSSSGTHGSGNLFAYSCDLEKESTDIEISVTYEGKTTVITNHVAGKYTVYSAASLKDAFTKYGATPTSTLKTTAKNGEVLNIEVSATTDKRQTVKFAAPFTSLLNRNLQKITFNVINPMSNKYPISFGCRKADSRADIYLIENYELKLGLNSLDLDAVFYKLEDSYDVEYFFFSFGNTSSKTESAKTVQFKSIVAINK